MRFDYVKYDDKAYEAQKEFKTAFENLAQMAGKHLCHGRPLSLVFTKLEEAYMWVGKAIRDDQLQRNGVAPLQEERGNE